MRSSDQSRPRVVYLLTDEISSVLVRGQLGHLVEHGFDVTVAARLGEPHRGSDRFDEGVTVEHVPFVREPSPLSDLRCLWTTVRLIRRVRPQIVNASTPKAGLLGSLAAWICRVPVRVYQVRGFRFETAHGWRRRVYRGTERLAIRCANHVVFNSRSLQLLAEDEHLIRRGRGEVIGAGSGNGIDLSRFSDEVLPTPADARQQLGVPADARVVGFVGRFTNDKGIADLVQAFEQIAPDRLDVRLLLVGQFEDGDPVPAATRRPIEVDDRIVTVPWLEHTGVAYRAMDVLAFPSYREGFPNVPLEAQLCGVPVAGYMATGTIDAVLRSDPPTLVPVGDRHELADAVARLLDDPKLAAQVGDEAAVWASATFDSRLHWQLVAARFDSWLSESR